MIPPILSDLDAVASLLVGVALRIVTKNNNGPKIAISLCTGSTSTRVGKDSSKP